MKKIIAIAALSVFVLASCKKDYTCECTTTGNGQTATASSTVNATKNDAKEACEGGSTSGSGYTTTCAIK